ncbi:MAG: class I SAM-dependent methyltransferase [Eubacteriales bacterium]|jgi:SAM-dependent methyltransferase
MNHISFDANYYRSYKGRNDIKAGLVLGHIGPASSVLDIGCNSGYMSEALLMAGKAETCHGVELSRAIVSGSLLEDSRFKLFECDITDFEFPQSYDAVLYLAVHHHVFGKYGKSVAMDLWRKIVNHCSRVMFFETGLLTGRGDLYWRDEMAKHYSSDKEHIDELLSFSGGRIDSVEVLARLSMNGTDRPIYKITFKSDSL